MTWSAATSTPIRRQKISNSAPSRELAPAPTADAAAPLLEADHLTRHFRVGGLLSHRNLHAVDDVNLRIHPQEIVAIVGESGSGKSTVARLLAGVYRSTSGDIRYRGRSISTMRSHRALRAYRSHVQMVFQDPYSSLNPVYPASHGITRALKLHRPELGRAARGEEAIRILESVGLTPTAEYIRKFPHELSGGQRQRFGFAQALASRPEIILADEPVSMLDVSIRIGVLNVMADLRRREGLSFLYITHDIASARYIADRLLVMYAGEVVEQGPVEDVLQHPKHPYTELLLSAVPDPRAPLDAEAKADIGEPPRVIDPGEGCRFRWRCPYRIDTCDAVTPRLRLLRPDHEAACHVAKPELSASEEARSAGA
jgi:oligopeptide/dipeptide ABC transporter ATP-binding protein